MGAFHEGHLSLMRTAKRENEIVVVSLFVNPTQFGKGEDYERYPRNLARDSELARSVGVDVLFVPSVQEIYPHAPSSVVHVPEVGEMWEGQYRPGHFDGVATVVCKLLNIVRPDRAYFGLKDLQQCAVIKRMAVDLNLPLDLRLEETVREPDGLAMSSRNVYLSPEHRALAPLVQEELQRCRAALNSGPSEPEVDALLMRSRSRLEEAGFLVDYLELVSLETMRKARDPEGPRALIVAAKIGATRLIDNILL